MFKKYDCYTNQGTNSSQIKRGVREIMSKKRILIVEDNDMNLKLYQYTLKSIDADMLIARDGNDALKIILSEPLDLVILDIQIPGISGLDVIKQVREKVNLKNLKVIAVTAYSMRGDREKILEAGCNEYVSKPINTREFPQLIREYLK